MTVKYQCYVSQHRRIIITVSYSGLIIYWICAECGLKGDGFATRIDVINKYLLKRERDRGNDIFGG